MNFYLTPEQESQTGYENPISIARYAELCLQYDFDAHEYDSLIDNEILDENERKSLPNRYGKALDAREVVLAAIAVENSDAIATHFADEIVERFESLLEEQDEITA